MYPDKDSSGNLRLYYGQYLDLEGAEIAISSEFGMQIQYMTIVRSSRYFSSYRNGMRLGWNLAVGRSPRNHGIPITDSFRAEYHLSSEYVGGVALFISSEEIIEKDNIRINGIPNKSVLMQLNTIMERIKKDEEELAYRDRQLYEEAERRLHTSMSLSKKPTLPTQKPKEKIEEKTEEKPITPSGTPSEKKSSKTIIGLIPTRKLF